MFKLILNEIIVRMTETNTSITLSNLLISLTLAFILGWILSFVYIKTNKNQVIKQGFLFILVIQPVIVTIIILFVGDSVARAFSLAGAFSIIRFTGTMTDTRKLTYILFTLAIGLAIGTGHLFYAIVITFIICAFLIIFDLLMLIQPTRRQRIIKITVNKTIDYENIFCDVMEKYATRSILTQIKSIDSGNHFELDYFLILKNDINIKDLIGELLSRNDNLNIDVILDVPMDGRNSA